MIRFQKKEFDRLTEFLSGKYGIDLSKKQVLAECRLNSEMTRRQMKSLSEFMDRMEQDKTGRLEAALLNRLTTNYTYFMREERHFEYLREEILPAIPAGRKEPYQIWCAGCSSGQECYSLSMLLQSYMQEGKWLPGFEILGTDISEPMLKQAEEARYPMKELDAVPETWRRSACRIDGSTGTFTVADEVRRHVSFKRMNLLNPYVGRNQYDLVVCRNVMIYFDEPSRQRLLQCLHAGLKKDGYLFVGHTELLPRNHRLFEYVRPAVYRKIE